LTHLLKVSYRTIDPDDTESGEYSDEGWENEEGTEYEDIEELYQALRQYMPFDSASYNASERRLTLYGSDAGIELATGKETYHDCHVENVRFEDVDRLVERIGISTGFS
jgi:hypothetical protein